jgi:FKBP-type peptidyl-prolyl cis-trans isomerase FkpA
MKKIVYTLLIAAFVGSAASAQDTKTLAGGVQCKIVAKGTGEKVKLNDVITFNVTQRTDKDSLLFSTYAQGSPVKAQVQASRNPSDLMEVFQLLSVQDSAVVKVPVDSVFKGHEADIPAFLKKGGYINYTVKIDKVQSLNDAIAERNAAMAKYKADELAVGDAYIKDHKLTVTPTASGLKYVVTKHGTGIKPLRGDSVYVNYVGRTARGKVFDTSIQTEAKAAGIEMPGRPYEPIKFVVGAGNVIPGWDEGLLLLSQGSKATFVIPSDLGYGEKGAGEDIKPFNTLVFDVELVKVIRNKKAVAATPKGSSKSPMKKRPAAKKKN